MYAIFPSDGKHPKGGVETATYNLLSGLVNSEIEVLVISFNKDIKRRKNIEFSKNIEIVLIPYSFRFSTIIEVVFHSKRVLIKYAKSFAPDLIHIQDNGSRLFVVPAFKHIPVVATPHAILNNELKSISKAKVRLNYMIMKYIEKRNMKFLSGLIFISQYYQSYFTQNISKVERIKSTIIFNAVNTDFFSDTLKMVTQNKLIYVGVINERKNLLGLLEVLKQLNAQGFTYYLEVIGDFEEESYRAKVLNYARDSGIQNFIHLSGWKSQLEVKRSLIENDIFVLPSKAEGLPVSISEAMALGRTVVATSVGGIFEIIEHGSTGFIYSPGNSSQLIEILKELYSNDKLIRKISVDAKKYAEEFFSPAVVSNKTYLFYKEILSL